jgi:hypothetical protein
MDKKDPTYKDSSKPKEGKSSRAKPPVGPIPRRSVADDKDVERADLVSRFGGEPDDWVVENGFWVIKNGS